MKHLLRISLVALLGLLLYRPAVAQIGIGISVNFAPPALPVYEQPPCPADGYLWTPGYWAWDTDDSDYYWVPGTWVMAPQPGLLWTPAWWGWEGGAYMFHDGWWGAEVGWYGGISYGFGYWGHGFYGGRWDGDRFMYNRAVFNVNTTVIHNVYEDRTVIVNRREETHVSYNGGQGGVTERPTPQEEAANHRQHFPRARAQEENRQAARSNPQMRASNNQGKPAVAATAHAGEFTGHDVVAAKSAGGEYHPPAHKGGAMGGAKPEAGAGAGNPTHARDLQPHQMQSPEAGAPVDKKAQAQQQKMIDKQNQEHQKLQAQQQKEDQKAEQQKWNDQKKGQMEQKHAQQTQQMEQRHTQQQQRVQPKPKPQ
jgi:hypothetical protein